MKETKHLVGGITFPYTKPPIWGDQPGALVRHHLLNLYDMGELFVLIVFFITIVMSMGPSYDDSCSNEGLSRNYPKKYTPEN